MLSAYRVLDLTDGACGFCGYLFGQLGAEVVLVEPPGGCSARHDAPLADGEGLWFEAYGRGKASVVTDDLEDLLAGADFLIESFSTGESEARDLVPESVAARHPHLIHISLTPFGKTGPKANWPATDLTVWAASGAHALAGDDDRAPVRTSVPQAALHAGADAVGAALIALYERHASGLGQHIDVSMQQSCAQAALSANLAVPNNGGQISRIAGGIAGVFPVRLTWPCRDGYIALTLLFGPAFTEPNARLMRWLFDEGAIGSDFAGRDWGDELALMFRGEKAPDDYFTLCDSIESFTRQYTQQELFEAGLTRGIYIAPTLDIAGLLSEPHFHARDYWHAIEGGMRVPGPFARFSATPLNARGKAPALGSSRHPDWAPRSLPSGEPSTSRPLAGLKVLDFMWVIAGPFFTRVLTDYGATVIKVESSKRLEPARGAPTFKDNEPGLDTGMPFQNFNAGKLGMTLDPNNEAARKIILELVQWADVVTESFSPKAMKAWGLDYESLRKVNPNLIMLSSCLMGQTGPRAQVPGYGNMAAAIAGFYDLTGWDDRSPAGPYLAYTDGVAPRFMLAGLMAALEHRRGTGEGQHIDLSQAEAAIHFLAPAILEYERTGQIWHRMGNRDRNLQPHGVYPAAGDDAWIAIACVDDASRDALRSIVGELDDGAIATWTITHTVSEAEAILIEAGVPAHGVQNSAECGADPQFAAREHFIEVPHTSEGAMVIENTRCKLSRTPGAPSHAGPELGEHNVYVLQEILGYDDEQLANAFASLAME
ncbi:MAG: hypothetical protein CMQ24_02005 [Gammaproteobacteria bacterium]|nr:hypothetical protein [Gammaproteobacteria bacterium]